MVTVKILLASALKNLWINPPCQRKRTKSEKKRLLLVLLGLCKLGLNYNKHLKLF